MKHPPLKSLHADDLLNLAKLNSFRKLTTDEIIFTLSVGQPCSLKARPDGTLIEGHHRIKVLRERAVDVDSLTREIVPKIRE